MISSQFLYMFRNVEGLLTRMTSETGVRQQFFFEPAQINFSEDYISATSGCCPLKFLRVLEYD